MAAENVYQFKITLTRIKPPIWRRIQVPAEYSFFNDLHGAIQSCMGWTSAHVNYHLHMFEMKDPATGERIRIEPDNGVDDYLDFGDPAPIDEATAKIKAYFTAPGIKAKYEYDFGDGWQHDILLEKIVPAEQGVTYPHCLAGKRACPPEDVGGIGGYENFLEIMANPNHEEHEEMKEWAEGQTGSKKFDPEAFDPKNVVPYRKFP